LVHKDTGREKGPQQAGLKGNQGALWTQMQMEWGEQMQVRVPFLPRP
jgi:hypothetical protein